MSSETYEKLSKFISSTKFGTGKVSNVVYNTAWAARIRDGSNKMAFPKCFDCLGRMQHNDGSWGTKHPYSIFDRMISTLITIIALKQWNFETNSEKVEKGLKFIEENLKHLADLGSMAEKMTIGFELIFPVLIEELESFGHKFNEKKTIDIYKKERIKKMSRISACENADKSSEIRPWHYSLEGLGSYYDDREIEGLVKFYGGLICASYGATAYALTRIPTLNYSLAKISAAVQNNGGIPSLFNVVIFDLAWCFNSLILSGYPIENAILTQHLDKLESIWTESKGMVGAAIGLPPDADDIANSLFALYKSGRVSGRESTQSMLKFYSNGYFRTFEAEKLPSLSTNLNCLIALSEFQVYDDISELTKHVIEWTINSIRASNYSFEDKWHSSKFYAMGRALTAFKTFDSVLCQEIIEIMLNEQGQDGGWGIKGQSTKLETSYVIIALIIFLETNRDFIEVKHRLCLTKAEEFFGQSDEGDFNFWIDKSLYSPINVDRMSILCAEYAMDKSNLIYR